MPCSSVLIWNRCWDGKNLDSPNHQDHVAHPVDGPNQFAIVNKTCPASHPVQIPQLMYEVSIIHSTQYQGKRKDLCESIGDVGYHSFQQPEGLARRRKPAVRSLNWRHVCITCYTVISLTNMRRTGFGQHGDYVFGWEDKSLQTAMDTACYLRNCSSLTEIPPKTKNKCQVPVTVDEDVDGCK
jgi:hypothetical protein